MNRHFSLSELVSVRPMDLPDADQVLALQQAVFPNDPIALTRDDFVSKDNATRVLVAHCESRIVGLAVMRDRPWRFWTSGDFLCVLPEFRDRGVGRALMETAVLHRTRPFLRIFCRPSNEKALTLYRSSGFNDMGLRKRNYPDGEDAIILMKWLGF